MKKKLFYIKEKKILSGKIFKNRIISSPISINLSKNGYVTKENISFFSNLAKSGVAMVTIGAAGVSKQASDTLNGMIVGEKKYFKKLKKLSNSIKKNKALVSLQLFHVGAQGNPTHTKQKIIGPSKYYFKEINNHARALTKNEIYKIKNDFVNAIIQAYNSNFDFIELHLAHGYLLHEFISSHFNKRKDNYGGKFENRLRLINEILNEAYALNPVLKGKIGFRISANDYVEKGLNIIRATKLVKHLEQFEPAYFVVTAGLYETAKFKYIDMKNGEYWNYAKKIKKITSVPVIAQGGITDLYTGNNLLKKKFGDFIGLAQSLIADPDLIKKTLSEKEDEIIPCIAHIKVGACHRCRYIKQKKQVFSCITPTSWKPGSRLLKKDEIKKDLKIWENLNKEIYKNKDTIRKT